MQEYINFLKQIEAINDSTFESTNKLNMLWTKLYLYEKKYRKEINNYYNANFSFALFSLIEELEHKPYYFFEQKLSLIKDFLSKEEIENLSKVRLNDEQIKLILDTIMLQTRVFLTNKCHINDIKRDDLTGKCIMTSDYIWYHYRKLFDTYQLAVENIFTKTIGHTITIINFNHIDGLKSYILDPTFRQFCLISKCNINRIYHISNCKVAPGYFMDTNTAQTLLENGYLELSLKNAKLYGDSFVLADQISQNNKENLKTTISGDSFVKALTYGTRL
ncbi:MAG: hypothetical protein RSB71_02175 [Bacilli bacterium]